MNLELAQNLLNWWIETGNHRIDEMKDPEVMWSLMFEDPSKPPFYSVSNVLFIVTNIVPGRSAVLYELGILDGDYDPKEVKRELINIVKEYELKRLTFASSSCVTGFAPKLKELGFKYEGRMKFAAYYNGKISDIDLYGFYSIKPAKRRRRGRRDGRKESTIQSNSRPSDSSVEQDSKNNEEARSGNSGG